MATLRENPKKAWTIAIRIKKAKKSSRALAVSNSKPIACWGYFPEPSWCGQSCQFCIAFNPFTDYHHFAHWGVPAEGSEL